jgi:glutamate racemase
MWQKTKMKKRIGCLHAHYSNIDYIETALSSYDVELSHFVDPGLMHRVTADQIFNEAEAEMKVKEQVEWIAKCDVDAILITCTNYIALLKKDQLNIDVPLILIDEPFFEAISEIQEPQLIVFTNPGTVSGTMTRLRQYAKVPLDIEVVVIENTFELVMSGRNEEYKQTVSNFLKKQIVDGHRVVSVAQLSMAAAAEETSPAILHPLNTLVSAIVSQIGLNKKADQA